MRVLSLFDGISVGRWSLYRLGVDVSRYWSSEIDKYAERISLNYWNNIERLGNVCDYALWSESNGVSGVDLLMGGSPCQGFSFAGKQLAFDDPRSKLFFEFVKCIKEFKPKFVMLENVVMKKEYQDIITETLQDALNSYGGGKLCKTQINSALVCAQNRKRIYWTNWEVSQPADRGIMLRDILLTDTPEGLEVDASKYQHLLDGLDLSDKELAYMSRDSKGWANGNRWSHANMSSRNKANCLTANLHKGVPYNVIIDDYNQRLKKDGKSCTLTPNSGASAFRNGQKVVEYNLDDHCLSDKAIARMNRKKYSKPQMMPDKTGTLNTKNNSGQLSMDSGTTLVPHGPRIRKLHPIECERLQTLPDNYTLVLDGTGKQVVSNTQRYKALGNGWTSDVIAHVLGCNEELTCV